MRKAIDRFTIDMFEVPMAPEAVPGSLNYDAELRGVLTQMLQGVQMSRHEVAARISDLTGDDVTKFMLDSWAAESREGHRFPLKYLIPIEVVCNSFALTQWLAKRRGGTFLAGRDSLLAEMGRLVRAEGELKAKKTALKAQLMGSR